MNTKHILYLILICLIAFGVHSTSAILINHKIDADEQRYLDQTSRLLTGSEMYDNGHFVNPPLLPIILAIGQYAGLAIEQLSILSVLATTLAALAVYSALLRICTPTIAFFTSLVIPLHPAVILHGSQLMTEPFAILFVALVVMLLQKQHVESRFKKVTVFSIAVLFAGLAMLKPLFGYVLTVALILSFLAFYICEKKFRRFFLGMGLSCCLAIVFCIPFLVFTYLETGKLYKWSTGTGDHIYWMSIGGEDVWGSWVSDEKVNTIPFLVDNGYAEEINTAIEMEYSERDLYLQTLARERIAANPNHIVTNLIANVGRVLFNYPYSFRSQSLFTYGYILPNMILYFLLALSFILLPYTWRFQDIRNIWILVFFIIYLAGNMLAGSTGRQGLVVLPVILIWLSHQMRTLIQLGIINFKNPVQKGDYLSSDNIPGNRS